MLRKSDKFHLPQRFPAVCASHHEGGWWFRVLGFGIRCTDCARWEARAMDGDKKLLFGRYTISLIRPVDK